MARRQKDRLTPKQERWFNFYMEIGNGSEAYRRAYDCAMMSDRAIRVEASRLINHPEVIRRREAQQVAWEAEFLARRFAR
jgi:phage terminase small subunit